MITLLSVALLVVMTENVMAQLKKFKVGLGIEGALPSGDFNNGFSVGGGLTARFELRPTHNIALNVTAGGIIFVPKKSGYDIKPLVNIPLKFGVKYILVGHLYGMAELGNTHSLIYYVEPNTNNVKHNSFNSFTYAPSIGVQLIGFDIGLRYESFGSKNSALGSNHFIGLRLGFGL